MRMLNGKCKFRSITNDKEHGGLSWYFKNKDGKPKFKCK